MSEFNLDDVLRQIMEGDNVQPPIVSERVEPPRLVGAVAQAGEEGVSGGEGAAAAAPAIPQAHNVCNERAGNALPVMTAPADTTVVTGEADGSLVPTSMRFPTFTTESIAADLDVRNYATLCRLRVRKWSGRKRDKTAARKAESDHGSVDGTYTAYKRLFAGTEDKLKAVNSVLDSARTRHYQMTLPWSTTGLDGRRDGPRLLANTLFMEYISEMGQAKQIMQTKFAELRQAYPQLLVEARRNLGSAFIVTEYPTPDQLEQMFALDFEFNPIPDGMDFKGLPAQQAQKLADRLNESRRTCLENAMKDVWVRLHTVVQKMAEALGNQKAVFHDTLVTNVRETVDLLEHLNATKDANVETIRQKAKGDLCRFEPSVLREDVSKRALTAQLARNILDDMDRLAGTSSSKTA